MSLAHPDGTLAEMLRRISAERVVRVEEGKEVQALEHLVATHHACTTLDLVAHAVDGVLQLGTWEVRDGDPHAARIQRVVGTTKLEAIRLIGCDTGRTANGQAAMRHLRRVFGEGVKIFGATGKVFAGNFDRDGFAFDGILIEAADL